MPTIILTNQYDPDDPATVYCLKDLLEALPDPIIGRLNRLQMLMNAGSPSGSVWIDDNGQKPSGAPLPTEAPVKQVETATVVGTIITGVKQKETATVVGTVQVGVKQVETATIAETVPGTLTAGNATVTVTAAGMSNSPKAVSVALATNDTEAQVAGKIATALGLDADVGAFFDVTNPGGAPTTVVLTAKVEATNDATMNLAYADDTCVGLAADATSDDTTAGVAPGAGNASVTVTAAGMAGSPKVVPVAVVDGDNANAIAGKIRTALGLDADVAAFFTVSGATDKVILEALAKAANDATMNIAIATGTAIGITAAPTSADTTAGVASGAGNAAITVTSAVMWNSPKTIAVAVAEADDASAVAGKIRTALAADVNVAAKFDVSGATDKVILTAKTAAADDATLNIAVAAGTSTGLTPDATSDNTTAGSIGGSYGVDLTAVTFWEPKNGFAGNGILPENIWLAGGDDGMLIDVTCSQL